MENNVKRKLKDDGTYVEITTTSTTPEDGFVPDNQKYNTPGSHYIKGYQVNKRIETDDPRIVKPFLYGICSIFYVISIILFITKNYALAIIFVIMTTITLVSQLKAINKRENELLNNPTYNPHDKEVIKEFTKTIKDEMKDASNQTFTKQNFQWFVKTSIPIYIIISLIISLIAGIIISFIFSIIYGILAFFISIIFLTIIAIIYFALVSLIFKH